MIARPTQKQLAWQDMELGVIIHLCAEIYRPGFTEIKSKKVRTELPADIINPYNLNTDGWLSAASKLGAKYAVLVANHCTGFSLWPTKENDYSIASTKWKDGKGDVIADFIASCRKYGIEPGLYYSTGCNGYYDISDEVSHDYSAPYYREYVRHVENQLTEIWTEYGELFEVWFDGGVIPSEKGGPRVFELLKKYQPGAITFQGPRGYPNNIRWIGNENGFAPDDCRCACNVDEYGKGRADGNCYCPAESDFPNRTHEATGGGWSWGENEEQFVIPPEELFECYLNTVGHNTNMLLGMGIATDGTFRDEKQFEEFGNIVKREFSSPVHADLSIRGDTFTLRPGEGSVIKYIVIREDLAEGQRITGYSVCADGKEIFSGGNIGHKRIIRTNLNGAAEITVKILSSADGFKIRDITLY